MVSSYSNNVVDFSGPVGVLLFGNLSHQALAN